MHVKKKEATSVDLGRGKYPGRTLALALVTALTVAPLAAHAAGGAAPAGPSTAVSFEEIPGSSIKRVILTARAAERLGVEIGEVSEVAIVRRQVVGGRVVRPVEAPPAPPSLGGFAQARALALPQPVTAVLAAPQPVTGAVATVPTFDEAWISVTLSPGEWERMRQDAGARLMPLATRDGFADELVAVPSGMAPVEDPKRSMLTVYYVVPDTDHGLNLNDRVRVELVLSGDEGKQTVVPYGAVYYDGQGNPWVYTNPKPLVFERQPIVVERIVDNWAVLSDGPAVGTPVATVGAALLFGAEVIFKR